MSNTGLKLMTGVLLAITALSLYGCGEGQASKNMEQLYSEKGIPVKTEIVEPRVFVKNLEYNAVITGVKESSAFATLTDKIETINYEVGDLVEKDAVVLTFPTDNPTAQYFQAKLTYKNAEATFDRMKSFYDAGGLSQQDYENAETSFRVAKANWDAIQQGVDVKAPISGKITSINVRESDNVDKEDELFTVAQIDRVKARVWVADRDISSIENGQTATATWNGTTVEGAIVQVDLSMNQAKKAFAVDVVFDNSKQLMRTGVTARIAIETYRGENTIFIERKNIITEDTARFVFLNDNGVAKRQAVATGHSNGTDVEILSGLVPGDELIVEGQMLLKDNMKLNLTGSN